MKLSFFSILVGALSFVSAALALGQDGPRHVAVQLEVIQVDQSHVTELLSQPRDTIDATALREQLDALIEAANAKVIETSYAITRSGLRARTESVLENIYAVEFDPAEVPQQVTGPLKADDVVSTPVHGTTYEMRPEGTTLEVKPQIGQDGLSIDLSLAPEIVHQLGTSAYGQEEAKVGLPVFRSQRGSTNISVISGNPALLGVHSVRNKDGTNSGRYTLVFVTATVKTASK